ncbi:hypothetical protein BJ165DRAFT_1522496 [Panaeolus papilionaceus]|nr:hypothetical protein BJ165DRAFT_1522496 [Panaeolus papilionaceus]
MSYSVAPNRDLEAGEDLDSYGRNTSSLNNGQPVATRSIYTLTRAEITRGVANRFVHSRTYIFLYLGMATLSVATVALSLTDGCPGVAFYVLEVIINTSMILEVGIRFVALGKQFWKSPFNIIDLALTLFCAITLLVLVFAQCGAGSKEEELFDTLLLVARNVLQFGRLASVMRQYVDLIGPLNCVRTDTTARRAGFMDLEYDSEEEDGELHRPLVRNSVLFEAQEDNNHNNRRPVDGASSNMPKVAQGIRDRDTDDLWAELG